MTHALIAKDKVAVVTGGASGIGLAAARQFAEAGMRIVLVDRDGDRLAAARSELASNGAEIAGLEIDVSDRSAVETVAEEVFARFGAVHLLMDNAAVQPGSTMFGEDDAWDAVLATNLSGVIHVAQSFGARMLRSGDSGLIVVTGSKQGITTPPGDPAYNVAKAGVKVFAEALAHELRGGDNVRVEVRLLIPGFVWTPLTAGGRLEKPDGAWTPEQTVAFMLDALDRDDFYILCPDGEVNRAMDERRILWAAGDIVENRPPLSRWHPEWADAFKAWVRRTGTGETERT